MESTTQSHKDPLEVHKENMKLLRVLPISSNRSAPNSPMMRRAAERTEIRQRHLSPSPQRKDLLQVQEQNRSKSLTHLGDEMSSGQSPKESPVGSPSLSVSEKLIRTHFLSNTTGKAGSYLLRKSDEIIRKKSPSGSPRYPSSPNICRKVTAASSSSSIGFQVKTSTALCNTSTYNEAKDTAGTTDTKKIKRNQEAHKQHAESSDDVSDSYSDDEVDQHLKDVRSSIGAVLSKKKSSEHIVQNTSTPSDDPPNTSKGHDAESVQPPIAKKGTKKHTDKKRHKYIVYGDTGLSPGYLTPPKESRGSIDLSAEMESWKRLERRKYEDLDRVEETSTTDSDNDGDHTNETDKPEVRVGLFVMPPVTANVAHTPKVRDFSVASEAQEMNDEDWDEMRRCRYLRIQDGGGDDDTDADPDSDGVEDESLSGDEHDNETI